MNATVVPRILRAYLLPYASVGAPQKGYRNESYKVRLQDSTMLNLMLFKSEPGMRQRIANANAVSEFLHQAGFPARSLADRRIIQLKAGERVKYGALYHYLPGHTIPWDGYTQDHIKLLGKTMSDIHAALRAFDASELPDVGDEYLAITNRMQRYFSDASVQRALAEKLLLAVNPEVFERFRHILVGSRLVPGKQALHMDFVRSNILFQSRSYDETLKVSISGILDFEKTALGHPLFDIARTLAFLMVDCKHKTPEKVRKYFLGSGYIKRGQAMMPVRHSDMLNALMELFLFYDFYKFLRHNPYEALPDNEHFIRTAQLLMPSRFVFPTTSPARL
jgi:Ser/Thr protein kinase RdoA (MazF antagonist)